MNSMRNKMLGELSVTQKKKIVGNLQQAYQQTSLDERTARRIRVGIEERLERELVAPHISQFRWVLIPALILLGGVAFWIFAGQMATAEPYAHAVNFSGTAIVSRGGKNFSTVQAELMDGDEVRTEKDGQVQLAVGAHRVTVSSESRLRLKQLNPNELLFEVAEGKSRFDVEKLSDDERLRVVSDGVTIEVVGTAFSVDRKNACVRVDVTEGTVRVTHDEKQQFVSAGANARFCAVQVDDADNTHTVKQQVLVKQTDEKPLPDDAADPVVQSIAPLRISVNSVANDTEELGVEASSGGEVNGRMEYSEEELLFENGHKALTKGALSAAQSLFQRYLREYPHGTFARDAQFRLVRIAYRQQRMNDVLQTTAAFLATPASAAHRTTEVHILRAQALLSLGRPTAALDELFMVRNNLQAQSVRHQHQITALQFTAACAAGKTVLCQQWSQRYASQYPRGAFIEDARKNVK